MPEALSVPLFHKEAAAVAKAGSKHADPALLGVTEGKTPGTRLEHKKCCDRWAK